jgi:Mg-chelatase subunit ChlD
MKFYILLIALFHYSFLKAQAELFADENTYDFGTIEQNLYQINATFVIANTGDKPLYILRADADNKVKVKVSKRQIASGDTALVQIFYFPNENGSFNEKINLISNAKNSAFALKINGKIKNYTPDDKQACFNFQAPVRKKKNNTVQIVQANPSQKEQEEYINLNKAIAKREQEERELNTRKKPLAEVLKEKNLKNDTTKQHIVTEEKAVQAPPIDKEEKIKMETKPIEKKEKSISELDNHKSNNLIFLIDISSSMRDSTKLPYLKIALYNLLDNIREEDKVTLITYADSIKILGEAINKSLATNLKEKLKPIKAKGLTKGKEAIIFAAKNAVKHYIADGNNEIILASDGEFKFFDENYKQVKNITENKNIKISTIYFGNEFKAQMNLRKISYKGDGFFIKISNRQEAKSELIEKIKMHSKIF